MSRAAAWGLSVGSTCVVLVRAGDGGTGEVVACVSVHDREERREAVRTCLETIARHAAPRRCAVVLSPPLADTRLLALPRLPEEELERILRSDLRRFVPAAARPNAVRVLGRSGRRNDPDSRALVTTVDEGLLEELESLAESAGVTITNVVSTVLAWNNATDEADGWHQVALGSWNLAFQHIGGEIVSIRRWIASATVSPVQASPLTSSEAESMILAARWAPSVTQPGVFTTAHREQRLLRTGRTVVACFAMVAVLVMASMAVLWGRTSATIADAERERASIADDVTAGVAWRDSVLALDARIDAVEHFRVDAPDLIAVVRRLDALLPTDTYLTSLRVAGDSVSITGESDRATPVLDLLTADPAFEAVRFEAPLQQRIDGGEVVGERFVIGALIRSHARPR